MDDEGSEPRERAFRLILDALSRGEEVDARALSELFPDDPDQAARLARAQVLYRSVQSGMRRQGLPPLLRPGERLGEFVVEEFLARGGMGEVYRARQPSLGGRVVALKIISSAEVAESEHARFEREAAIASSLHHPHMVEVYGYWHDEERGLSFYAMRLVEGPTLREVLGEFARTGRPPAGDMRRELVRRFLEVARALAALHDRGLIHRDVKPANIVLEGGADGPAWRQPAVLVDFGLVRSVQAERTLSSVRVTPPYAAPERLLNQPVDARADVFSLGVSLHDVLAARRPAQERERPVSEGLEPLATLVPGVDRDLAAVVARAVEPEARWRYPDASALAADLGRWLDGKPVAARPLRGLEGARRWVQRHPAQVVHWGGRALAAALLVLLSLAGLGWGIQVVSDARTARERWSEGDLAGLLLSARDVPAALDGLLLPGPLADLLDAARAGESGDGGAVPADAPERELLAARDVLGVLARKGEAAALLRAARYLQRDGLPAHPTLAGFLLRALARECATPAPPSGGRAVLALVARLFYERPDLLPHDAAASAGFRETLKRFLLAGPPGAERLDALTALSGCGTMDDVLSVLSWAEARADARDAVAAEGARLALVCLEVIVRRRHLLASWTKEELKGLGPLLRRVAPFARQEAVINDDLEAAEASLFVACALVERMHDRRASRVDPSAGLKPDSAIEEARGRGPEEGRNELARIAGERLPTLDTQLGWYLDHGAVAPVRRELVASPLRGAEVLLEFDFSHQDFRGAPEDLGLETREVHLETARPADGFARLGTPGVSELCFEFNGLAGTATQEVPVLSIVMYKGDRQELAYRGRARLDVRLDGEGVLDEYAVRDSGVMCLRLPLHASQLGPRGRHVLTLRLGASSNTTLRVQSGCLVMEPEPATDPFAQSIRGLRARGELERARALQVEVVAHQVARYGEGSSIAPLESLELAEILVDLNALEEARGLVEQVLDSCRRELGEDHPLTRSAVRRLAALLDELEGHEQAHELRGQAGGTPGRGDLAPAVIEAGGK